jgi:hypothetical protein
MAPRKLTREVAALVHHVELNRAGWWQKTLERLIESVLWMLGDLTTVEVREALSSMFSVDVDLETVTTEIGALRQSERVVELPSGAYRLAEACGKELEGTVADAEGVVRAAKERFREIIAEHCEDLDPEETWAAFDQGFLVPFIEEMGARTYELVSGQSLAIEERVTFRDFVERYPERLRPGLQCAAVTFLDSREAAARAYILRQLNGRFMLQAANFDARTVEELERSQSTPPTFAVFVDTNFLFSILGLHENPSNEAAERLMWLADVLKGHVDLKFYVAPITIDEARGVLEATQYHLGDLALEPKLAVAADSVGNLTGMVQKYVEESKKTGRALAADQYFGPYVKNLVPILRSKQVEIFNERMDEYRARQDVVDDLNQQWEFQKSRPIRRPKSYEAIQHDMVMWHFVEDKRPAVVGSLLDAHFWIVTVDFRLLAFDSFKRRGSEGTVPVCVHPASLMQVLQLWVPRSEELETALLDNFRLPFLLREFDPAAEQVTVSILRALSRFEDVGDLPEETVVSILLNEALRQRLASEPQVERQIELVREGIIEEHEKLKGKLGEAQTEAARLSREVASRKEAEEALQERVSELESSLQERDEAERTTRERTKFVALGVLMPLIAASAVALAVGFILSSMVDSVWWQGALASWSLLLMAWLWMVRGVGSRSERIAGWGFFDAFVSVHRFVFATLLVGLAIAVLGAAVWDYLKDLL